MAKLTIKEEFFIRKDDKRFVKYNSTESENQNSEIEHNYEYFACTCADEDKKYWKQRLHDYMPDFDPEIHADLVSQLVMEINQTFNGTISIYSDMWFGISTTCHIWDDKYENYEIVNIFMQCDEISIGLMAIYDILCKVVENND